MEIKVGGKYNQRDGGVVGPMEVNLDDLSATYPFKCNGMTYTKTGIWSVRGGEDFRDLISEYVEPTDATPAPTTETAEYGPWIAWNGTGWKGELHHVEAVWLEEDGTTSIDQHGLIVKPQMALDTFPKVIAYRELIEPENVTDVGWWDFDTEQIAASNGFSQYRRKFTLTVQGDAISAEWAK